MSSDKLPERTTPPASADVWTPGLDDGPRAPATAVWQSLTPAERERLREQLGPTPAHLMPPTSDPHINAERAAEDALGNYLRTTGRRAYIGRGLTVYYPEERRFEPDFFVVLDVAEGERMSWIVDHEGRGLDFVLEIHFAGRLKKDEVDNVERYARLGIPEYFLLDLASRRVRGWRLEAGQTVYTPVMPQGGQWRSEVLDLHLVLREGRLRFMHGGAVIPLLAEINAALEKSIDEAYAAADAARAELEAEKARAEAALEAERARAAAALEAERARAEAADAEVARLREELRRLRGEP